MFLQQALPSSSKQLSSAAAKILLDYQWPGNVRELQNLMYYLSFTVRSETIEAVDLEMMITVNNCSIQTTDSV